MHQKSVCYRRPSHSDAPFQAIYSPQGEHEPISEGDLDDPGDNPRKRAAALRAQPTLRHTSTAVAPALRYRSQPRQKSGAIGLRAGERCICFLGE